MNCAVPYFRSSS